MTSSAATSGGNNVCLKVSRQIFGNFLQLLPVPNARTADDGKFCPQCKTMHHICLTKVKTQTDKEFVEPDSCSFHGKAFTSPFWHYNTLFRPLVDESTPPDIFGTNLKVDMHNADICLDTG